MDHISVRWFEARQTPSKSFRILVIDGRVAACSDSNEAVGTLWSAEEHYLAQLGWTTRQLTPDEP